jgi:hypothetical protein
MKRCGIAVGIGVGLALAPSGSAVADSGAGASRAPASEAEIADELRAPTTDAQRGTAERVFRRSALRFGPSYEFGAQHTSFGSMKWYAFRGDADQDLPALAFYDTVGRADLADAYRRRHALMVGGYAAAGLAFGVGAALILFSRGDLATCNGLQGDAFDRCVDDNHSLTRVVVAAGIGLVAGAFGTYFYRNPHPIDENDAKALADAYNQRLRRQLGLPIAQRAPLLHDVALAPTITAGGAVLSVGGRL